MAINIANYKKDKIIKEEAKFNPLNMKKEALAVLFTQHCKHGHLYAEHPSCYLDEYKNEIKTGFIDIESSNLKSDFGIILSYCIKEQNTSKIWGRTITKEELTDGTLDKNLVRECIEDMSKFNLIVTYYGTKFDLPFIRSRALYWGLNFPIYGSHNHRDLYYVVKSKLCISRNRLETACRLCHIEGKTHLDGNHWIMALTGNKKSLDYIFEHNRQDVIILQKLYDKLIMFVRDISKSI
jgi:uncharacterized protein YprB with RNaseH-like and TPR domain